MNDCLLSRDGRCLDRKALEKKTENDDHVYLCRKCEDFFENVYYIKWARWTNGQFLEGI